jgi:GNAT superfamily N-acetyltransferase
MVEKLHIAKLELAHDASRFDCGNEALNRFIKLHALPGQRPGISQTYVALSGQIIIGYHTLAVGSVVHENAPERLKKVIPRHPVPVVILARLAVDNNGWHGRGLGAGLVLDAIRRVLQAAEIAGVRALLVHAKDDAARAFYEHLGFEPFPGTPLTLYRLLKDIRAMLREK